MMIHFTYIIVLKHVCLFSMIISELTLGITSLFPYLFSK